MPGGPSPSAAAARSRPRPPGWQCAARRRSRAPAGGAPAGGAARGDPPQRVTGWAGPWPLSERWWDPSAAWRRARFQLATEDGRAWLAVLQDGRWLVAAGDWFGGLGQPAALLAGVAGPGGLGA